MNKYETEAIAQLRALAPECMVLLKSNGDFPLQETGKIAAFGSGVRQTIKGGTGSGEVNSRFYVTIEQGLENAGFTVTTKKWMSAYEQVVADAKVEFHKVIKARAKANHTIPVMEGMGAVMPEPEYDLPLDGEGDVAIYVASRISGEGNDRQVVKGDILLSDTEKRDILALQNKYKKFLLVLNVGGPVDLSDIADKVDNILYMSQLGVVMGDAFADVLCGKAYPSGKLTTTWAAWNDYCNLGEFGDINDTRYQEGIYVGYRYFDTVGKKALFPFGYGLSYTTFALADTAVSAQGEQITVSCNVTNTGAFAGKEIVQVYVSVPEKDLDQPYQTLAAFAKTKELAAGASEKLTASFSMHEIASYDEAKASYVLEAGDYIVRVGTCSTDTIACGVIRIGETIQVLQAKNCLGTPDFTDWKPSAEEKVAVNDDVADLTVIEISEADVETGAVAYNDVYEIDDEVKALSDEELAFLNIGAFDPKAGAMSIIGNASNAVAGAAGDTTVLLKDKGFKSIVMADGPAGLRLNRQYFVDEKGGIHGVGAGMPESIAEFMPKIALFFMGLMETKPKKGQEIHDQYCTAIPIGTAIAQSWNPAIAEVMGDIVGKEMELFGVHLWLAPALNIHRSILCGRNFEYFSEDPLLSGVFAAAITNGVQKHPGCGTTIKHYAANNQENNRYTNNSQVSERAMREIYLRGFDICVKTSQPHAVMTSFNLLNGTHTSEHRGLIEDILRNEFGYEGIVMTDWIVAMAANKASIHPNPAGAKIAAAGGDLVMPGSKGDYESVLAGLKDGSLSREQVQMNATRVYRMANLLCK